MPATGQVAVTTNWTLISTGFKALTITWLSPSPGFFALTTTADPPASDVGHIAEANKNLFLTLEASERLWVRGQVASGTIVVTEGTP
jgi:hypothetical protein